MFKHSDVDDSANRYIREKIRQARTEANESQEDLAQAMGKSRVTISDIERGRVIIGASDLGFIAAYYDKPVSYFYPPRVTYQQGELTPLQEELLSMFDMLPETQQLIALEYIKQQLQITQKARERATIEEIGGLCSKKHKTN